MRPSAEGLPFESRLLSQWDSWLTSAMPHPFFVGVEADATSPSGYKRTGALPYIELGP